jgi:chromosome condensin MukBEF complex kleisin-like MukF subunit
MIVRISGEDQYRVADEQIARLNELDNAVVSACEGGDEAGYERTFAELLDYVRANGERVADDELAGSDLILPPSDLSFAEAGKAFNGEGLIPD